MTRIPSVLFHISPLSFINRNSPLPMSRIKMTVKLWVINRETNLIIKTI